MRVWEGGNNLKECVDFVTTDQQTGLIIKASFLGGKKICAYIITMRNILYLNDQGNYSCKAVITIKYICIKTKLAMKNHLLIDNHNMLASKQVLLRYF